LIICNLQFAICNRSRRTAIALACLLLACANAGAQESHYEPQRLSQAIEINAQPLPVSASDSAEPLHPPSITSFPFRQISASEPAGSETTTSPRKLAPRSSSPKRSLDRPAAATPTAAIGTVVSSLAIVLGLFAVLAWFSKRFAPAGSAALPKEAVELLGRAPLAGRQTMQLIRVGNRLLLVALSTSGAETLTEITDPVEVEHLAGLCRGGKSDSASASFSRVLSQLATEPAAQSPRARARGAA
jgi:flagellar biogenesis protein FliO